MYQYSYYIKLHIIPPEQMLIKDPGCCVVLTELWKGFLVHQDFSKPESYVLLELVISQIKRLKLGPVENFFLKTWFRHSKDINVSKKF